MIVAGAAVAGTTAAGIYTALAPVNDKRDIRCYFHADLTTRTPLKTAPGQTRAPFITAGIADPNGANATKDPKTGHLVLGNKQVSDPVNLCSRTWSLGMMNPDGITNDLIPADFVAPEPGNNTHGFDYQDQNGNPLVPDPQLLGTFGHYIPHLSECVVDNTVAVIPGGPEVCAHLGIPTLQK
jgi:hypothetical protein